MGPMYGQGGKGQWGPDESTCPLRPEGWKIERQLPWTAQYQYQYLNLFSAPDFIVRHNRRCGDYGYKVADGKSGCDFLIRSQLSHGRLVPLSRMRLVRDIVSC